MKNVLDENNIRFGIVEENGSKLEDIAIEIIQKINIEKKLERQRVRERGERKEGKKEGNNISKLCNNLKGSSISVPGIKKKNRKNI